MPLQGLLNHFHLILLTINHNDKFSNGLAQAFKPSNLSVQVIQCTSQEKPAYQANQTPDDRAPLPDKTIYNTEDHKGSTQNEPKICHAYAIRMVIGIQNLPGLYAQFHGKGQYLFVFQAFLYQFGDSQLRVK